MDPSLTGMLGHHFGYAYSLMDTATERGFQFSVLAHKSVGPEVGRLMPVRGVFQHTAWDTYRRVSKIPRHGQRLNILLSNLRFYRELRKVLNPNSISPDSFIFTHMITAYQLTGWAWWASRIRAEQMPALLLLFRYSADWFLSRESYCGFRLLERVSDRTGRLSIATDSQRLANDYSQLTRLNMLVVPIPHANLREHVVLSNNTRRKSGPEGNRPLRLASLGSARDEKGFLEILKAIRQLHSSGQLDRFEFDIQSTRLYTHRPETRQSILTLMQEIECLRLSNVRFIDRTLSTEQYYELIDKADVILLPYWRAIYPSRTSGILAEALAAGKRVIVTEDTWMSDQLERFPAGVTCRDRDPDDLVRAILEMETHREEYARRARAAGAAWADEHNPESFIGACAKAISPPPEESRIGILYPWGDAADMERQSGGSHYLGLLTDFLQDHYDEIRVISPGGGPSIRMGRVTYSSYQPSLVERILAKVGRSITRAMAAGLGLGRAKDQDVMLWLHYQPFLEWGLARQIEEISGWADVVLLQYTFWARATKKACQRNNKKLILIEHDVVSEQITNSRILKSLTLRLEIDGLNRADHVICVSPADQRFLEQHGVDAEVILPAVDTEKAREPWSRAELITTLKLVEGFDFEDRQVVLFVGSYFEANIIAAQSVRRIANRFDSSATATGSHPLFVTIGACAKPERSENYVALGRVQASVLKAMYLLADLVLIPLPFGTGSSIKTIEAMAYGKAILGTKVAFRGYPVDSGVHCLIWEEIDRYPDLVLELLEEPERRERLGLRARKFSEAHDYRMVYRRYLEVIEGFSRQKQDYQA